MNELPEECIAKVLSYLGPLQSCSLAPISTTFSSASQSDVLWETFLPPNYRSIVSQSSDPSILCSGSLPKKQLFRRLSERPILIHQGKRGWMVEKQSGKITVFVGARDLSIAWGDDVRYWQWETDPDCRCGAGEVAVLRYVWWLDIRARIRTRMLLSPDTRYAAYLVFKLQEERSYFFEQHTVKAGVGFVGGCIDYRDVELAAPATRRGLGVGRVAENGSGVYRRPINEMGLGRGPNSVRWCGDKIEDGWSRVKLGEFEFQNNNGEEDEVEMFLMEVVKCKAGLVVHGIEIIPLPIH